MNMSVNRAVAISAAADETGLRSCYERAVSHDAANTLCNPMSMGDVVRNEARILRTSGILADKMGIEQSRVLAFVYIYACLSASWIERDGREAQDELTIAELVELHIAHVSF